MGMKITISGAVGSGKSTVSKLLAKKLGYKHYSMGEFMREIAKKRNLSIMDLSKIAETDSTIDEELDELQRKIGKEEDNFIMDSRLGFHFIPNSFKIFFNVDVGEAAKRILSDKRAEETYKDVEEAKQFLKKRMRSENVRYKEYYGIDFPKKEFFDIMIDTSKKKPEEVVEEIRRIMEKINSKRK
jgi:cytidylate kinase